MKSLRAVYTIWYRDVLRFWHDKVRMFGAAIFPLLFLFGIGSGLSAKIGLISPGVNFEKFVFPGTVGGTVLISSFMGGVSVVWDREFGFLKEVLVAPISRAAVAVGKTLGSVTLAMIQASLILVFSPLVGISLSVIKVIEVLGLMLILGIATGSTGVFLAARIKSIEAFQIIVQTLMFPMLFLSGVFFPLDGIPSWLNFLVKINPATYGIVPIRQVMLDNSAVSSFQINIFGHVMSLLGNVLIMVVFAVIMIFLAMSAFSSQK